MLPPRLQVAVDIGAGYSHSYATLCYPPGKAPSPSRTPSVSPAPTQTNSPSVGAPVPTPSLDPSPSSGTSTAGGGGSTLQLTASHSPVPSRDGGALATTTASPLAAPSGSPSRCPDPGLLAQSPAPASGAARGGDSSVVIPIVVACVGATLLAVAVAAVLHQRRRRSTGNAKPPPALDALSGVDAAPVTMGSPRAAQSQPLSVWFRFSSWGARPSLAGASASVGGSGVPHSGVLRLAGPAAQRRPSSGGHFKLPRHHPSLLL